MPKSALRAVTNMKSLQTASTIGDLSERSLIEKHGSLHVLLGGDTGNSEAKFVLLEIIVVDHREEPQQPSPSDDVPARLSSKRRSLPPSTEVQYETQSWSGTNFRSAYMLP
jgi:hypothetical protein